MYLKELQHEGLIKSAAFVQYRTFITISSPIYVTGIIINITKLSASS